MSLETAIRSILLDDATITTLVGDRVRPLTGMQGERRPLIAFEIDDGEEPSPKLTTASSFTRGPFTIVLVADTYAEVVTLAKECKRVLHYFDGTTESTTIAYIKWDSQSDVEQQVLPGEERPVFVRTQTYRQMAKPA